MSIPREATVCRVTTDEGPAGPPIQALLLGGAPGVGKTSVARHLLSFAAYGSSLTQWVDVDDLWRHQPWRVDAATRNLVRSNLAAVAGNAAEAGVHRLIITWVYQSVEMQQLVRSVLPLGTTTRTVQLRATEGAWRARFDADPLRPPIDRFFEDRYNSAQRTPADHLVETDGKDAHAVACAVAEALGIDTPVTPER